MATVYDVFFIFLALSPALSGLFAGVYLSRVVFPGHLGICCVVAGVGGVVGLKGLAGAIFTCDRLGIVPFNSLFMAFWCVLAIWLAILVVRVSKPTPLALALDRVTKPAVNKFASRMGLFVTVFAILLASYVTVTLYQAAQLPLSSWDALGFWGQWPTWFLDFYLTEEGFQTFSPMDGTTFRTRQDGDSFPLEHPRHPMTLVYLSAYTASILGPTHPLNGWMVYASFVWLCAASIVYGFVFHTSQSTLISLIALYLFVGTPLIENHAVMLGYADLWLVATVLGAVALMCLALLYNSRLFLSGGLVFSLLLLFQKNSGLIYLAALWGPLLFVLTTARQKFFVCVAITAVLMMGAIAYQFSNAAFFPSESFGISLDDNPALAYGGYQMPLGWYPLSDIALNFFWAFLVNLSFSTAFAILVTFLALSMPVILGLRGRSDSSVKFISLVVPTLLLVFAAPQLLETYAERFASPNSDLGNSRFIMGFAALTALMLGYLPSICVKDRAIK